MRTLALALLLPTLGGCAWFAPKPIPGAQAVSAADQASCEKQAENDPGIKLMMNKQLGSEHLMVTTQEQLNMAKRDATVRCLQSRGLVRRGGVERQKEE